MKIKYEDKRFRASTELVIEQANAVIKEYQDDGYTLTLRQIYYQFVSRDIFPDERRWSLAGSGKWVRDPNGTKNATPNYNWLGDILNKGRMAGLVDWKAIEDRTRKLESLSHWDDPNDIIYSISKQFRTDAWRDQERRVEVWIEKEALAGVFERVCERYDVPFFCCRGYTSLSEMWNAAMRLRRYHEDQDKEVIILHFGDHDPSGIDMTRDIVDRMRTFGANIEVRRKALNMDQVEQWNPPPNPAKTTDSRYQTYMIEYGYDSWELDALGPDTLASLVEEELGTLIDWDVWNVQQEEIADGRKRLAAASENWESICDHMDNQGMI